MEHSVPLLERLAKRLHPHTRGYLAEKMAALVYGVRGYTPLKVPESLAQTDLTLRRGQHIVLVEVKFRQTWERGSLALKPQQRQRLARQARLVAGRYPAASVGVELLLICPRRPWIKHIVLGD